MVTAARALGGVRCPSVIGVWWAEHLVSGRIRSILVVDDHDGLRDVIAQVLAREGYFVLEAANGTEVFAVLSCATPDLLLLDLSMPTLDGRHVFGAVRVHHPRLPVVLITGAPDAPEIARELGAAGYLSKPFGADALLATVATHLEPTAATRA
jgi:DNA-binding NtrC family response regulator